MSQDQKRVKKILQDIENEMTIEERAKQLMPRTEEELKALNTERVNYEPSEEGILERRSMLERNGFNIEHIKGEKSPTEHSYLQGNIENYIGMAQVPIGLAGPLLINGTNAQGDFYIPMATTEGALVASYSRGMKACRESGGITAVWLAEGIQRSPFFKFESIFIVGLFVRWVHEHLETFHDIVKKTSRFAQLTETKTNIEGNSVILTFEYSTGDAAGQNMVTICTDQICKFILENFQFKPIEWFIESNYSGDKKATVLSFTNVRGKKVTSEVVLPREKVQKILKTSPEKMSEYWQSSTLAVTQSGSIGAQGHIANGLTALFIACGQDVACVSESSIGLTRMEMTSSGDLYVSLTLPALIIGTIGGGTSLPTQNECLTMLDCAGQGKAKKFAEICTATCLAGEVSIASAMSADHFTKAHKILGRKNYAGKSE